MNRFRKGTKEYREEQDKINEAQRKLRASNNNAATKSYEKTEGGFIMRTYRNMKSRVLGINKNKAYLYKGKYILPKEEFYSWALNDTDFKKLFFKYKKSGYKIRLCPSIDRINPIVGYELGNIRFIEHYKNSGRARRKSL